MSAKCAVSIITRPTPGNARLQDIAPPSPDSARHSMSKSRISFSSPAVLLLLVLTLVLVYQAGAQRNASASTPVVVTINLSKVMSGLQQRSEAQAVLDKLGKELQAEDEQFKKELEAWDGKYKEFKDKPANDPGRMKVEEDAALALLRYKAWQRYSFERVDTEKSLQMRELNRAIKRELARLCDANGYDIVLANDSDRELTLNREMQVPAEQQVLQQIAAQRVLHARKSVDVTDALIVQMNNAYAGGAAAAPANKP